MTSQLTNNFTYLSALHLDHEILRNIGAFIMHCSNLEFIIHCVNITYRAPEGTLPSITKDSKYVKKIEKLNEIAEEIKDYTLQVIINDIDHIINERHLLCHGFISYDVNTPILSLEAASFVKINGNVKRDLSYLNAEYTQNLAEKAFGLRNKLLEFFCSHYPSKFKIYNPGAVA